MEKDEVEDLLDEGDEAQVAEVKEEAPKDVRGFIRHAMKEVEAKEGGEREDEPKGDEIERKLQDAKSKKVKDDAGEPKEPSEDTKQGKVSKEEKEPEKKEEIKIDPPPYYKNKGKTVWDKLSAEDKNLILAREKEVSDGFEKISPKVRAFDELAQVIEPRREAIQRFGVTPAQTIDRLFQWMEGLSHQNLNHRANTFKQLAQSFGINLAQLAPQLGGEAENFDPADNKVDPNNPPPWFQQYTQAVDQKVGTIEQQLVVQRQVAANSVLMNWAKDKPHFEQVRGVMHGLIQAGVVPLKDGEIDLDGAYVQAIKLDPEISAQIQQEADQKAKVEAVEKAKKDAQAAAARLAKAKSAGSGLKPAAPSLTSSSPKPKANGAGNKPTSVRDSLRASLTELRDS